MQKFREFYFGTRSKFDRYQIIECAKNSKSFNKSGNETVKDAIAILLWESKNQNSWLVRTNERIYKIIDDIRKERPIINWSRSITLFKETNFIETSDYKLHTGKIKFLHKPEKEYRYSKKLFFNKNVIDGITDFIKTGDF